MAEESEWAALADMMASAVKMTNSTTNLFKTLAKACEFRIVVSGTEYAPDGQDVDCCKNMEHKANSYRSSWDKHAFCEMLNCPFVIRAAINKMKCTRTPH